jgi:signal transduction histidine kinase
LSLLTDCDSGKIRQVIFNLLDNAVRFTFQGKIVVTTQLVSIIDYFNNSDSTSNESQSIDSVQGKYYKSIGNSKMVIVSIQNEGEGVHPEIKDQMFEKFATKSAQGTGLGLYLSKKIVESHGGIIWMEENDNLNIILDKKENIGDNINSSSNSSSYPDIKKRKKITILKFAFPVSGNHQRADTDLQ